MRLITSSIENPFRPFVLLASPFTPVPSLFHRVDHDPERHDHLLAAMQRFRGGVYLRDQAIEAKQLTPCGRHKLAVDEKSWHLITLNRDGEVSACARFLLHRPRACWHDLWVRTAALAGMEKWGPKLRQAMESELASARDNDLAYVELGGWALAEELRSTTEALRIALASFAWAQAIGGSLGVSTVTARNGSASILRRIGGRPLEIDGEQLPPYYDPHYRCEMEILRFDSREPEGKFAPWIEQVRSHLISVPVITNAVSVGHAARVAV